jgi:N-acetylneuraminic acid mutarotase
MKNSNKLNPTQINLSPYLKRLILPAFTFIFLLSISPYAKAQTWSNTGSLATARHSHTATLLSNGKVLVAGGESSTGAISGCELYDPSTGTWSSTGSMSFRRRFYTATLLSNGKVLVCGGEGSSARMSSCELYNPSTGTWSNTGSMTNARRFHTATLLSNGKVLVSGGDGASGPIGSCELYDPSTGTWSSTGSLNTVRTLHAAALLSNGKVIVSGGFTTSGVTKTSEIYDPSSGTWTNTGSSTSDRYSQGIILLPSGKVLINGGNFTSSCELYDPATGTMSSTGSMSRNRGSHSNNLLSNGRVLVSGGFGSTGHQSICELYNVNTGTWSNTGSLATARTSHTATTLSDGTILVTGGEGSSSILASCEIYTPECIAPTTPTLSTTSSTNCGAQNTTLSIASRILNSATNWQWYSGSCGGTSVGSGTSIVVAPSVTTTYYARGEGGCVTPGSCASITITVNQLPTTPTLSAIPASVCNGGSTTINITSGSLNAASNWKWYSGSCGGTIEGTGTSVSVSPTTTTTYYVRGEGTCTGSCGNITVVVNGVSAPIGTNTYTGNVTLSTQSQVDAFYSNVVGTNFGKRWSKIIGNLVIDGSSNTDPITNLCNLASLTEIARVNGSGGTLAIINFNQSGNPTDLSALSALTTLGCTFSITDCPQLLNATLPSLTSIGCFMNISNNAALQSINIPNLYSVQGDQFNVKNNPKLQTLSFSTVADSFRFTGKGSSVDISNNGNTATGNLTMNLKKITKIRGALVFNNNDNPGVNKFDYIFTGLTDLETAWGKLTITNNDYLGTCCIAASVTVSGTGKRHIISGNTGNCIDSATVLANCGSFNKRSSSNKSYSLGAELTVSPNPSSGLFELNILDDQGGLLTYTICDLTGRTLFNQSVSIGADDILPLQLGSMTDGTYLLKAELNGEVFVKRLMVVK